MVSIANCFQRLSIYIFKNVLEIMILIAVLTLCFIWIKPESNTPISTRPRFQAKTLQIDTSNILFTDSFYPNIGVLVEFRSLDHIIAVVINVIRHIPRSWPIQIIHGKENEQFIRKSMLAPLIATGKVTLTLLNKTIDRGGINKLLTNPAFWKRVRGEKVLFFQVDSAMCSNSPHKITDFLKYDYIGAPWDLSWFFYGQHNLVGNGGFSLRTRSKILALLALRKYDENLPEDVWYAQNMHRVNGLIPSVEIAKTFAVESIYYDRPLGVHRFGTTCQFRANISVTCPESMLVIPISELCQ